MSGRVKADQARSPCGHWQKRKEQEFILGCLLLNPSQGPVAHDLLFHQVLFEVHSLKLLAAHCFIAHQYLRPENVVVEKTKELDLSKVMAEIRQAGWLPVQWRYSELSFLELDKFLEDVRWCKMQCNMEWQEERRQWHLTLLLTLEDKLHCQLSYDLLPSDNGRDLAAELVYYGFISQDDREKLAAFLEGPLQKPRAPPPEAPFQAGGQKGP